jgi:hypothetical protein
MFVITDPRTYDGNPYEVAERAVRQAEALAGILVETIELAALMARNAEMERDLVMTGECDAPGWPDSAQGRRYTALGTVVGEVEKALGGLAKAAAFDPKAKIKVTA